MADDQQTPTLEELEQGDEHTLEPGVELEIESGDSTSELPSGEDEDEDAEDGETVPSEDIGNTMVALQAIINRQSSRLDELKDQVKKINESVKSIFENDAQLAQAEQEAKEATRKQKERKTSIAQSAEAVALKYKLGEVRDQVKDLEESLNNHLLNFYQMTGAKFFDTDSGEQREFAVRAKLLSKKKVA